MAKTWTIREIDGSNPREVTLAEFRAEHRAKVAAAQVRFALDRLGAKAATAEDVQFARDAWSAFCAKAQAAGVSAARLKAIKA